MRGQLGGVLVLAVVGTVLTVAPAGSATRGPSGGGECEVRTMAWPEGADDGTVMDIEVVPGLGAVYYGSYVTTDETWGMARRAVVWYGLDAQPVQVGPPGTAWDIAFELTSTGMINGQSVVDETGRERAWVQSLRTGQLTWVDVGEDGSNDGFRVRRINDRGEAAGTVYGQGFSAEAKAWWPRVDRQGRALPGGELEYAEAWAITNKRDVAGSVAVEISNGFTVLKGVIWSSKGAVTELVSNPGVEADTYPRVLSETGQAAGSAWYGDFFDGHGEAARWPAADTIESLGLLPGGGFSGVFGQSEEGWVVGLADRFDPDSPGAQPWGAVEHSVMWTGEPDMVRVLPSPFAVASGQEAWQDWFGGVAHGVHTGLDQVGTSAHGAWDEDGSVRLDPTVYVNASRCGQLVPTTHTAFWEDLAEEAVGSLAQTSSRELPNVGRPAFDRPAEYQPAALRERAASLLTGQE